MKVMVETSAHHVHVSEADLEALFGKGAALTNKKDLSQPGQFACEEKVEVVGPKGTMKMSILGPTRPEDVYKRQGLCLAAFLVGKINGNASRLSTAGRGRCAERPGSPCGPWPPPAPR